MKGNSMNSKSISELGRLRFGRDAEYNYVRVGKYKNELDPLAEELWNTVICRVEKDGGTVLDDPETASAKLSDKINFFMSDSRHIDEKFDGEKPTGKEIYEAAGISKSSWGRIKSGALVDLERGNVFALAVALRLNEEETEQLLHSAGYCINYELELDCAIMFFIRREIYDMKKIRETLGRFSNIDNGFDCFTFRPKNGGQMPKKSEE